MITKIESGKVDISQKKILSFAKVLNTTPAYLMGLDSASAGDSESPDIDPEIHIVSGMMETMTKEQRQQVIDLVRILMKNQKG